MKGIIRQAAACLLALMLALGALPARTIRAEDTAATTRHDLSFVTPKDVDIWEDGTSIYVKHNGVQRKLASGTAAVNFQSIRDYLVTVETYPDSDGEQVTVIYFNIVFQQRKEFFCLLGEGAMSDGSVYRQIALDSNASRYNNDNARIYYVTIKGDEISDFVQTREVYGNNGLTGSLTGDKSIDNLYATYSGLIFWTPFLQGKYKVYCSKPVYADSSGEELLIPETPLPAASQADDSDGELPYKTTFRLLTDGATVYNTFYYTSCYLSGADEISASGKVRMDATKLADGTVHRVMLTAPQLLCQISSYGTAYDIVYTNDDSLCSFLGIEKPQELRWNVHLQRWISVAWDELINGDTSGEDWDYLVTDVVTPDNTNPFTQSDAIPSISGLTVSQIGMDARILFEDYNTLYGNSLLHVSDDPQNGATPWGLGSSLSWTLGSNSSGHTIDLRLVVRVTVQLSDGTTKYHSIILHDFNGQHPGNNTNWSVSASSGRLKVALYDLVILLQQQYREYIAHPPAKLLDVQYALTPFYEENGKYYRGKSAYVTQVIDSSFQAVPSDPTVPSVPDPWDPIVDGTLWDAIKDIVGAIPEFVRWIGDLISQGIGLFSKLGQIPAMLADVIPFIPEELWTVISFGILLYFAPAIVRGIRNLILLGLGG